MQRSNASTLQRFLLLLFSLGLSVELAGAQGTAFTYQGRLTSGTNAANGKYDLTFALFSVSSGPGQLGSTLTDSSTSVSNGFFTVTLDFGANFPGADRWLEISVRTNGGGAFTTLAPRQKLTPSPYAIYSSGAATAGNLSGTLPATQLTGTVPLGQLPGTVVTNNASSVNLNGSFTGNGAGVTNVQLRTINSGGAISSAGTFVLASSPAVGDGPYAVTAADVNGDGKADLISANGTANTLTVLTNSGKGTFVLLASPGVGLNPRSVVAADVNGDGRMDLISANNGSGSGNTLTVLTNKGNNGFLPAFTLTVGSGPISVAAGDVNGDGKLDLISANSASSTLSVLTNNGSGGFVLASSPALGSAPDSVTSADVNGDGKLDLITSHFLASALVVLTNNGNGGFVLASSYAIGGPHSVAAADINGDGRLDLITANAGGNTLTVLTNNGSGGFVLSASPRTGSNPNFVTAADVNGDGKTDLVSADGTANTLTVLTNNGSGGFALASSLSTGTGPNALAAMDLNGDGRVDLISANLTASTLSVLFNVASFNGSFTGDGGGLTGLSGANLQNGTVTAAKLGADIGLWTPSGANVYRNSGKVGIGTTAPGRALQVGDQTIPGSQGMIRLGSQTTSGLNVARTWDLGVPQTGDDASGIGYSFVVDDTALGTGPEFMIKYGTGNVGIGTINPTSKLFVVGDFDSDWTPINPSFTHMAMRGGGPTGFLGNINDRSLYLGRNGAADVAIQAGTGNVGIGKTDPATALDVNGTVTAGNLSVSGTVSANNLSVSGAVTATGDISARNLPGVSYSQANVVAVDAGQWIDEQSGYQHPTRGDYPLDTINLTAPATGFLFVSAFVLVSAHGFSSGSTYIELKLFNRSQELVRAQEIEYVPLSQPKSDTLHISWVIPVNQGPIQLNTVLYLDNLNYFKYIVYGHNLTAIFLPTGY